jgi:hypothetical protein
MKTLKQIREEYNNKSLSQLDNLPEELMLEDSKVSRSIPSFSQMPALLLFRRVTYKMYPNKQVVALYYSKLVDKYLSVPFGPTGNLNLSEAQIFNTMEELEEGLGDALTGAVTGGLAGFAKGGLTGALRGAAGGALKGLFPNKDKENTGDKSSTNVDSKKSGGRIRDVSGPKTYSSFSKKPDDSPISKERQRQASLRENKISDLRQMVKEGVDSKDISINGRTITLNTSMAKRILEVYDSVNTKNKKIVEGMLNEDLESFKKLLNFSVRN